MTKSKRNTGRRTVAERLVRLGQVASLMARNQSETKMAELLGVSRNTIRRDKAEIIAGFRERCARDIDDIIAEQVQKLDQVESELWQAWEKSKEEISKTTTRTKEGEEEVSEQKYQGIGDPRFISELRQVYELKIRLLGLDRKAKDDANNDLVPIVVQVINSREELEASIEAETRAVLEQKKKLTSVVD